MRRLLITPLFLFCLIINPAFMGGCGESDDGFTYGESELLSLAATVSSTSWTHTYEGDDYLLKFELSQGTELEVTKAKTSPLMSAWACTERGFVRDAEACIHMSRLALEGTLTVTRVDTDEVVIEAAPVGGHMEVMGLHLSQARVFLTHEAIDIVLTSDDGERFELTQAVW